MVYLNLSVVNIEETVEFYSKKLGVFGFQSDRRLLCNLDVGNLAGQFLAFTDLSNNKFKLHTHLGFLG
jgi:hypothetical protein